VCRGREFAHACALFLALSLARSLSRSLPLAPSLYLRCWSSTDGSVANSIVLSRSLPLAPSLYLRCWSSTDGSVANSIVLNASVCLCSFLPLCLPLVSRIWRAVARGAD